MDYLYLLEFVDKHNSLNGFTPATYSIFTYDNKDLVPIRIAVVGPGNRRFKANPNDSIWQFAKRCAQCSDMITHELKIHLTYTHFMTESIIVGIYRILTPKKHFISLILEPHLDIILPLNNLGRINLIDDIKIIMGLDATSLLELVGIAYGEYNFVDRYIENDLEKRGHLKDGKIIIQNYDYAKDAMLLWSLFRNFWKQIFAIEYKSANSFENDSAVKSWIKYVQDVGCVRGFPDCKTKDDLIEAITMIEFVLVVQHSAVNYSQPFYYGYVENASGAIYNWDKFDLNSSNKEMNYIDPKKRLVQRRLIQLLGTLTASQKSLINVLQTSPIYNTPKYAAARDELVNGINDYGNIVALREKNGFKVLDPKGTLIGGIFA